MFQKIYFLLVLFSFNNVFFSITNSNGNVKFWKTVGLKKLKGIKKLTQSSIKLILNEILNFLKLKNLKFHLKFTGINKFKNLILKFLYKNLEKKILSVQNKLLVPYNGCKLKKKRRL